MAKTIAPYTQEHLHSMGVPQWPIDGNTDPWPLFQHVLPKSMKKRLAGNATCPEIKKGDIDIISGSTIT